VVIIGERILQEISEHLYQKKKDQMAFKQFESNETNQCSLEPLKKE